MTIMEGNIENIKFFIDKLLFYDNNLFLKIDYPNLNLYQIEEETDEEYILRMNAEEEKRNSGMMKLRQFVLEQKAKK